METTKIKKKIANCLSVQIVLCKKFFYLIVISRIPFSLKPSSYSHFNKLENKRTSKNIYFISVYEKSLALAILNIRDWWILYAGMPVRVKVFLRRRYILTCWGVYMKDDYMAFCHEVYTDRCTKTQKLFPPSPSCFRPTLLSYLQTCANSLFQLCSAAVHTRPDYSFISTQ